MANNFSHHKSIVQLTALALFAVCLIQQQGRAQRMNEYILSAPSVGLTLAQSLRFTLFNPDGSPVRAQARLYDARGAVIAASGEASIPASQFHSFDFKRGDIPLAGETGTGRLQLRAVCTVTVPGPSKKIGGLAASIEVIEDGTSNIILRVEIPARDDPMEPGFGNDFLIGIIPGQALRCTVVNANKPGSPGGRESVRAQVKLFDSIGDAVAESNIVGIPPGEFRSLDFDRDELPLLGEPGTDRAQVRGKIILWVRDTSTLSGFSPASLEIVDTSTGHTGLSRAINVSILERILDGIN
jgi:hypothetical protein